MIDWISVEQMLPPESNWDNVTQVLIYSREWGIEIGELWESNFYGLGNEEFYPASLGLDNVIYWMPLPQPPEDK